MVVNNNAAAVLLVLAALAGGREVLVSRGESVEIGGGFRVPEVMAQSGARLVDVGTTNRTRAADYAAAIGRGRRALVLKVHPSNYRVEGFVESATVDELAALGVPVVADLGSGLARRDVPVAAGRPAGVAGRRARRPPDAGRRRRAGDVQRRQAARRPAGRDHRRSRRPRRAPACATRWPGPCGPAATCSPRCRASPSATSTAPPSPASRSGRWPPSRPLGSAPGPTPWPTPPACGEVVASEAVPGAGSAPGTTIPSIAVARRRRPPRRAAGQRPAGDRPRRGTARRSPTCARSPSATTGRSPRPSPAARRDAAPRRPTAGRGCVAHGGARRSRQVVARPLADGHRPRPLRRGAAPGDDDRPRLRPYDAAERRGDQLRRRARARPLHRQHARRRRRGRRLRARRRRHRGLEAADRGAPAHPRARRCAPRTRRADDDRPRRRRVVATATTGGGGPPGRHGARRRRDGRLQRDHRRRARRPARRARTTGRGDTAGGRPRSAAAVGRPQLRGTRQRHRRHRHADRRCRPRRPAPRRPAHRAARCGSAPSRPTASGWPRRGPANASP